MTASIDIPEHKQPSKMSHKLPPPRPASSRKTRLEALKKAATASMMTPLFDICRKMQQLSDDEDEHYEEYGDDYSDDDSDCDHDYDTFSEDEDCCVDYPDASGPDDSFMTMNAPNDDHAKELPSYMTGIFPMDEEQAEFYDCRDDDLKPHYAGSWDPDPYCGHLNRSHSNLQQYINHECPQMFNLSVMVKWEHPAAIFGYMRY